MSRTNSIVYLLKHDSALVGDGRAILQVSAVATHVHSAHVVQSGLRDDFELVPVGQTDR